MGSLRDFSGLDPEAIFIETGTGTGATLQYAADYFKDCISIESDEFLFKCNATRFCLHDNVMLCQGLSHEVILDVVQDAPTVFWLDAHYTGNGTRYGWECPLLDELKVITRFDWTVKPVILIDDAFMFGVGAPPADFPWGKFNRNEWPYVQQIDDVLQGYSRSLRGKDILEYRWKSEP